MSEKLPTVRADHAERTRQGFVEGVATFGGAGGFGLTVAPLSLTPEVLSSPLVCEVGQLFDVSGFGRPREPLTVATGDLSGVPAGLRISSLPIKFPGSGYRVPSEFESVRPILEAAAAFEHAVNFEVADYYAYLTIQQTEVAAGEIQRGGATHSDGIQGPRIQPKAAVERGYLMVDRCPPIFFCYAFDVTGVSPDLHLMDGIFETQANPGNALSFPPNTLIVFDSYCVHRALPASSQGPRTFLRVAYSTRQYDRSGNTVNDLFGPEYEQHGWVFAPRPLPTGLTDPPGLGLAELSTADEAGPA